MIGKKRFALASLLAKEKPIGDRSLNEIEFT